MCDMKFMPTGGINEKNLLDYLSFKQDHLPAAAAGWCRATLVNGEGLGSHPRPDLFRRAADAGP